jgi:hypothetical protein
MLTRCWRAASSRSRAVEVGDQAGENGSVEVAVAPLAGGLGSKQTCMAGCSVQGDALGVGVVLPAERVRGTEGGVAERASDVSAEFFLFTEADEPAEGSFGIGRSGVEQHAGHWAVFVFGGECVEPLSDRGLRIAAFQSQPAHQRVREAVHEDVAKSGVARGRVGDPAASPPRHVGSSEVVVAFAGRVGPVGERVLSELDEDAFTVHLCSRKEGHPAAGEWDATVACFLVER